LSKDKAEFSLLDSYNRRILTDIKKYKYVKPNVVVGYSETPEGYFILNLEDTNVMTLEEVGSGSLIKKFPIGLTKNEWMHELKQLNILQEPELITLSSFYNCK
jgi:hypothetical protein